MTHKHDWLIHPQEDVPICLAPGHEEGYRSLSMGTAWSRERSSDSELTTLAAKNLSSLAAKLYHPDEVKKLLSELERQILTHSEHDFVSEGGTNFVSISRVLRSFDEAKKKIDER